MPVHKINGSSRFKREEVSQDPNRRRGITRDFFSAAIKKNFGETGDLPQESAAKVLRNRAEEASLRKVIGSANLTI